MSLSGAIAYTAVVTHDLLREYLLFRRSFALYHDELPQFLVRCDAASRSAVERLPNTIAVASVPNIARPPDQFGEAFRAIVIHKMLAIEDAWRLLTPRAVVLLDADVVITSAIDRELPAYDHELTLSPHYWTDDERRRNETYGIYNAGIVMTRSPRFARWWLEAFEARTHRFGDQHCLDLAPHVFRTRHFPPEWNVGFWRRRDTADMPHIPNNTRFFHAHVLAPARPDDEWEVSQKRFVGAALNMLERRATPSDLALVEEICRQEPSYRLLRV